MLKRGQQCKKADLIKNIASGEIELDYLLVSFFYFFLFVGNLFKIHCIVAISFKYFFVSNHLYLFVIIINFCRLSIKLK